MRFIIKITAWTLLCLCISSVSVSAAEELVPVGRVVGLELRDGTVSIADFDAELGVSCQKAGVQVGDVITKIDGNDIHCIEDVRQALGKSDGTVRMEILRGGQSKQIVLNPQITKDGPKLGAYLRQGVTGIGMVSWFDPETGKFGTLGHGVNNQKGKLLSLETGNAYEARVVSVKKGKSGTPGQLIGAIEKAEAIGVLEKNSEQGVFGTSKEGWQGSRYPVADVSEIRAGKATILSTVEGVEPREYSVEILKIYPKSKQTGRNMLLRVTDKELLDTTGGIVQGMSGSPIIQNGKVIGAVTHVLINDPTTGYGIFIENMLDAAA